MPAKSEKVTVQELVIRLRQWAREEAAKARAGGLPNHLAAAEAAQGAYENAAEAVAALASEGVGDGRSTAAALRKQANELRVIDDHGSAEALDTEADKLEEAVPTQHPVDGERFEQAVEEIARRDASCGVEGWEKLLRDAPMLCEGYRDGARSKLLAALPYLQSVPSQAERQAAVKDAARRVREDTTGFLTRANPDQGPPDCDDLCTCGHHRYQHMVNETEEGHCHARSCTCKQFILADSSSEEEREPNENEWCCDCCGAIAPVDTPRAAGLATQPKNGAPHGSE